MELPKKSLGADAAAVATARSASDVPQLSHATPGPWFAAEMGGNAGNSEAISVRSSEDDGDSWVIADVWADVEALAPHAKANALLIAAAPELLEALKQIVGLANETIDGAGVRYTFDARSPIANAARTAIAKAEGRS